MTWTGQIEDGLARLLNDKGVAVYEPDGFDGNIILGALPDEIDTGIGVQAYDLQPDHLLSDVVQPVQLFLRGATKADAQALFDSCFDALEGVVNVTVGGIPVSLIELNSSVPLGIDGKGRTELTVNYYLSAQRQTASRLD
ncbi:MAG TPA: minor capsid protein [Mycobacteriales bacterium]|nr:minor capsid protein [Mycobacteriales bacterium]